MPQIRKICYGCKKQYWDTARSHWQHATCGVSQPSDLGLNPTPVVSKDEVAESNSRRQGNPVPRSVGGGEQVGSKHQRWAKDKYNAYMKDYMKVYRRRSK